MLVGSLMRREPAWVTGEVNISEAARIMMDKGIRSVIVCDQERNVKGIVTDTDIIARGLGVGNIYESQVAEIMTKDPVCASPEDDIFKIVKIMSSSKFRRMPVTDKEGKLTGIISIGDIAPRLMLHLELLREKL